MVDLAAARRLDVYVVVSLLLVGYGALDMFEKAFLLQGNQKLREFAIACSSVEAVDVVVGV